MRMLDKYYADGPGSRTFRKQPDLDISAVLRCLQDPNCGKKNRLNSELINYSELSNYFSVW